MIRKRILRWLFGEDSQTWKDMFRIAVECSEISKRTLNREAYLIGRYGEIVDRENKIFDAVKNSSDFQLQLRILDILNENLEEEQKCSRER